MKSKSLIIPTIFTIFALLVLLILGTWQIQRLLYKENLIKTLNEQATLPAIELPENLTDILDKEYRLVRLRGEYLHDKEMYLFTGSLSARGPSGYNILTPFKTSQGRYILVDRGWVGAERKSPDTRPETLTSGSVDLVAMIHKGERPGRFTPDNDVVKNLWFWIDIDAIKSYAGVPMENIYVRLLKTKGEVTFPIAGDATIKVRNDHLQYAITWYTLAVILIVIYFLYSRKLKE
jgi:surfeit locus 1 family protein